MGNKPTQKERYIIEVNEMLKDDKTDRCKVFQSLMPERSFLTGMYRAYLSLYSKYDIITDIKLADNKFQNVGLNLDTLYIAGKLINGYWHFNIVNIPVYILRKTHIYIEAKKKNNRKIDIYNITFTSFKIKSLFKTCKRVKAGPYIFTSNVIL